MNVLGVSSVGYVLLLLPAVVENAKEENLDRDCDDKINDREDNCHDLHKIEASFVTALIVIGPQLYALFFRPGAGEHHYDNNDDPDELCNSNDQVDVVDQFAGIRIMWLDQYHQSDKGKHTSKGKCNPIPLDCIADG